MPRTGLAPSSEKEMGRGRGGSTQLGPIGEAMAQRFRIDLIIDNVMCNSMGV